MSEETELNDIEELKASIEALSSKNRELLGKLKAAKDKARGAEIDPEEYSLIKTENEELKLKLDKAVKDSAKSIEQLQQSLSSKDTALQSYLIDNGLSDALVKAKVRPEMMPAVKAMLKPKAALNESGGEYVALMGDKPLTDAIAEWAASDEGKHFIFAPENSGGGASGGSGGSVKPAPKGDLSGDKRSRIDAIRSRFPELNQ